MASYTAGAYFSPPPGKPQTGVVGMSNQHTQNHNDSLTFVGALSQNDQYEAVVDRHNLDDPVLQAIPWRQFHRANVPHLARRSN